MVLPSGFTASEAHATLSQDTCPQLIRMSTRTYNPLEDSKSGFTRKRTNSADLKGEGSVRQKPIIHVATTTAIEQSLGQPPPLARPSPPPRCPGPAAILHRTVVGTSRHQQPTPPSGHQPTPSPAAEPGQQGGGITAAPFGAAPLDGRNVQRRVLRETGGGVFPHCRNGSAVKQPALFLISCCVAQFESTVPLCRQTVRQILFVVLPDI